MTSDNHKTEKTNDKPSIPQAADPKSMDMINMLSGLVSESQNPDTLDIDLLGSRAIVEKINQQDHLVSQAISLVLDPIATAVDAITSAIKIGGRLIYLGAGTSGRLGVLDAAECIPTFGIEEGIVVAVMAGGEQAMFKAVEGIEDNVNAAVNDLQALQLNSNDVLVGIAASGRTPYVISGLNYAKQIGAQTIALSCNPTAEIALIAELAILPIVGPEPLSGSTRMKSGTAQKLVLNMLSTATMIRLGKTYKNLMVDVKTTNKKLYARGVKMILDITGCGKEQAVQALQAANNQVKVAILMIMINSDAETASNRLSQADGFLRQALIKSQ